MSPQLGKRLARQDFEQPELSGGISQEQFLMNDIDVLRAPQGVKRSGIAFLIPCGVILMTRNTPNHAQMTPVSGRLLSSEKEAPP